jgi:uncharacterized membrane protein HdeD (DUF308 family)
MDSIVNRVEQVGESKLKSLRWALGINGALSIALGVLILIWPGISLFALTIVFGAFTTANGVVGVWAVISGSVKQGRGWLVLSSLLGIGIGVAVLLRTDISALALLYVIGAYAVSFGIIAAGGAFWLPLPGADRALLVFSGFVSILFGIVMFAKPGAGALVLLALIGAFSLVKGIGELVVAIGGKRMVEVDVKRAFARAQSRMATKPQPTS